MNRKVVHYTLLAVIIFLQLIVIAVWYSETKLSEALVNMESNERENRLKKALIISQGYFNSYIGSKDITSLQNCAKSLNEVSTLLDSLHLVKNVDNASGSILKNKKAIQHDIIKVKSSIDSIINKQTEQDQTNFLKSFKFKEFEIKKFLDDVKTDSYVKVDSITQKGLFSRLNDAFANRTEVQKEYVNTMITMQYKDNVSSGSLDDLMSNIVGITNKYYANEFSNLKQSFISLRENDQKLIGLNNVLLSLNQKANLDYGNYDYSIMPNNDNDFIKEYKFNKSVRSYSIILLIILMLVVSGILFYYTRIAFEYEKNLTAAKERIRQSLNFKNRITGMISHEIRSPLSIISMYSKKASSLTNEPELKETFKSIEFTTNSLLLLSNQILKYSKEENHELTLKLTKIHLKAEVDQIIKSMTALVQTKGNSLETTSNLKVDDIVYSDAIKIYQLFYNLIGNANKFTENGKISVNINLEYISDFEMNFKVIISDNGIGIAENDLAKIFESYYQGTVSDKVNDLGVGLGLNICKEIIELFDGEISIESKPESGTKVIFNLILTQE